MEKKMLDTWNAQGIQLVFHIMHRAQLVYPELIVSSMSPYVSEII